MTDHKTRMDIDARIDDVFRRVQVMFENAIELGQKEEFIESVLGGLEDFLAPYEEVLL